MRIGRFVLASTVLFIVALLWNGFLHMIVLSNIDKSVSSIWRPNFSIWLSMLMTFGIVSLYVLGYSQFARKGTLREGVSYGLFFAVLAGLLVDLNQYILYPIPVNAPLAWFAGGIIEFVLYGVLVTKLYPIEQT